MPKIRSLRLICRACGSPVIAPEPPEQEVTCVGCQASLGTVADLSLTQPAERLRQRAAGVLALLTS